MFAKVFLPEIGIAHGPRLVGVKPVVHVIVVTATHQQLFMLGELIVHIPFFFYR